MKSRFSYRNDASLVPVAVVGGKTCVALILSLKQLALKKSGDMSQ